MAKKGYYKYLTTMTIEQKAKAYDEALKRARKELQACGSTVCDAARQIFRFFPELKESEDERIRKALIDYFNHHKNGINIFYDIKGDDVIAWLEKQGEQKIPVEMKTPEESLGIDSKTYNEIVNDCLYNDKSKPTPRFHEGEWVVDNNGKVAIIYDLQKAGYVGHYTNGTDFVCKYGNEHLLHLWTIQDAKDGDVLATDAGGVFIYAKILYNKPYAYCGVDKFGVFKDNSLNNNWTNSVDNVHPSTKEQRDILFTKMKEAGYEWDAELKKVSKITTPADVGFEELGKAWAEEANKQNLANSAKTCKKSQRMISAEAKEALYDKPAWSEEDERNLQGVIDEIEANKNQAPDYDLATYDRFLSWLKSLKERYTWRPSDEQMDALHYVFQHYTPNATDRLAWDSVITLELMYRDLKKLRGE